MNCKQAKKHLLDYLEGELKGKELAELAVHLESCQQCREKLEALVCTREKLRQTLKMMVADAFPSPQVEEKIKQRLTREVPADMPPSPRLKKLIFRRPVWQKAFALALLIICFGIFISVFSRQPVEAKIVAIFNKNPQIQAILNNGIVKAGKISVKNGNTGFITLIIERNKDFQELQVVATIDIKKKQVTSIKEYTCPALSEKEKNEAIAIASTKPEVQEILKVTKLKNVRPAFPSLPVFFRNDKLEIKDKYARIILASKDSQHFWLIRVNLTSQEVLEITSRNPQKDGQRVELKWDEEGGRLKFDAGKGGGGFGLIKPENLK